MIRIKKLIKNRKDRSFWMYLRTSQRESLLKHPIMRIKSLLCAIRFIACGRDRNRIWIFANFLTPSLEFQPISKFKHLSEYNFFVGTIYFRIIGQLDCWNDIVPEKQRCVFEFIPFTRRKFRNVVCYKHYLREYRWYEISYDFKLCLKFRGKLWIDITKTKRRARYSISRNILYWESISLL